MTENDLTKDQVTETAAESGSTEAPEAPPAESAPAPVETPAEAPAQPAPPAPAQDQTPAPVEDEEDIDQEELARLYEQSLRTIQEGEVARGTIVAVENDYVVVDIGYKSEGQIDINEFKDADGNIVAEVGQEVDVLLERAEDDEGTIILSREKAAKIKVWDEISRVYNDDGVITGTIVGRVKGGMSVDIGVQAFLPGSQVDLRPVRNLDALIGQTFEFKILKFNKKRSNIVLSRRALLEIEREAKKKETLKILEEGRVMDGVVKNITDYGVFVDLGGIDGLLHITDMSWGRVGHPSEMFSIGDEITVKILNFDRERERVSLGLKQLKEDPWTAAAERYPVGTRIVGRVVSLADYGAFVEVEEGIEGLIHVSEMSWTRKVRHPSKIVNVGDVIEAKVVSVNRRERKIGLSMRRLDEEADRQVYSEYVNSTQAATSNLGALLKEGLAQKVNGAAPAEEPAEEAPAEEAAGEPAEQAPAEEAPEAEAAEDKKDES